MLFPHCSKDGEKKKVCDLLELCKCERLNAATFCSTCDSGSLFRRSGLQSKTSLDCCVTQVKVLRSAAEV